MSDNNPIDNPELAITQKCDDLKALLLEKNRGYGNSALDPVRIFSRACPVEQLLVRIDDKISRIARGQKTANISENEAMDIAGYLVLLSIAQDRKKDDATT